ncbi:MAG: hypothetical protein ACYDB7_11290, partial [Mycobacteriales bacterium]
MVCRPLSPLYVAVAVAACAAGSTRARLAALSREPAVRGAAVIVVGAAAVYLAWLGYAGRPAILGTAHPQATLLSAYPAALAATWARVRGTLTSGPSTAVDPLVLALWILAAVCLAVAVLSQVRSPRPARRGLGILAVVVVFLPPLIEASQVPAIGYWWQPRYELPFLIGLPILAARCWPGGARWGAVGAAGLLATTAGGVVAFAWAVQRYQAGGWRPLGGAGVLISLDVALTATLWSLVLRSVRARPSPAPELAQQRKPPTVFVIVKPGGGTR